MKKICSLMLAAALTAFTGTNALAGAPEGSWYVAPQINGLWLDDSREADDDIGATLNLGRTLSTNWDAEISFFASEHDRAGGEHLELTGVGVRLNRIFYREGRVNPFLSIGLAKGRAVFSDVPNDSGLLGLYGAADPLIAPETVDAAQDRNRGGQWLLYDGAGHELIDDGSPEYDPAAAADADSRIAQFFQATLPKPETVDLG